MTQEYTEINMYMGNIQTAVDKLKREEKERGCPVKLEFNGHWLYSDTVTLDSAYKEITGKTKAEHDKMLQEIQEERDRKEREFQASLPEKEKHYIEKGHEILSEDKWELWDEIVPVRLRDLYHGMELGNCLDIVEILNSDGSLEDAKKEMKSQGHSGMSWGLVKAMVASFSDRGKEFFDYVD